MKEQTKEGSKSHTKRDIPFICISDTPTDTESKESVVSVPVPVPVPLPPSTELVADADCAWPFFSHV